jgi:hypothetical protein
LIFRAAKVPQGADETLPHQYTADPGEVRAPAAAGIGAGAGAAADAAGAAGTGAAGDLPLR